MKKVFVFCSVGLIFSFNLLAGENCKVPPTDGACLETVIQKKVKEACEAIEARPEAGQVDIEKLKFPEVEKMQFDCCNYPNYVWINTNDAKAPKMLAHPSISSSENLLAPKFDLPEGNMFLFFMKKATPSGAWVSYLFSKTPGAPKLPKRSWVRKCKVGKTGKEVIVGSGTWQR